MRLSRVAGLAAFASVIAGAVASGQPAPTPTPSRGAEIFAERCKDCHEAGDDRTPPLAELAKKSSDEIVAALTTGPMAPIAEGLTPDEKRAVAAFLTAR